MIVYPEYCNYLTKTLILDLIIWFFAVSNLWAQEDYENISVNTIKMYISNNGSSSVNPPFKPGFLWPGGIYASKPLLQEDGLIWGGVIDDSLFINGIIYFNKVLQPGKILDNGSADDPNLYKYRIYKIKKGWETLPFGSERDKYEKDYNEWPVEDGAPWEDIDGNGIFTKGIDKPRFLGDEVLWFVSNDMNKARILPGQKPIGLEFQTTLYGLNNSAIMGNTIFKKVMIINKSGKYISQMYIGLNNFVVIGNPNDNFVGCDTLINLGYGYNASNRDEIYGTPAPAEGHLFLQTPVIQGSLNDSAQFNGEWKTGNKNLIMPPVLLIIIKL